MSCPLFFCLQLGNSALPPVAILVLAANLIGQAAADRPIPLIKGVLLRQQQHKTRCLLLRLGWEPVLLLAALPQLCFLSCRIYHCCHAIHSWDWISPESSLLGYTLWHCCGSKELRMVQLPEYERLVNMEALVLTVGHSPSGVLFPGLFQALLQEPCWWCWLWHEKKDNGSNKGRKYDSSLAHTAHICVAWHQRRRSLCE